MVHDLIELSQQKQMSKKLQIFCHFHNFARGINIENFSRHKIKWEKVNNKTRTIGTRLHNTNVN
jgi:hypothetical protein